VVAAQTGAVPALPAGAAAPASGALPAAAVAELGRRPFGVYIHVPFCATRCGYCDFNTYTAGELGSAADPVAYVDAAVRELELAARVLGSGVPPAQTVFVGGGTPTLLPAGDLVRLLQAVRDTVGLAADAEVTTEANPESVDPRSLAALRAAGFTRLSLGMQSASPHVLAVLDRRHRPGRPEEAAREATAAGFAHVNLDLIYGTPGESAADWRRSLDAVLAAPVDHVSAYALVVEEGTALARRVARGEVTAVDDDVLADRWLAADAAFAAAGLGWYEVSNWARDAAAECRHNRLYWSGGDWWGIGPGAHSHVGGVRWWNVKHPAAYAGRLAGGASPAHARELLDGPTRSLERVMLGVRLREGLPLSAIADPAAVAPLVADGLVQPPAATGRVVLTQRGRLLADAVVRALV
jgi:putative oxygen-independent coproporphyrinogen III oxidase